MVGREIFILILTVYYCSGVDNDKRYFTITSVAPCDLKNRTLDNSTGTFVTTSIKRVNRQTSLTKVVVNVTKTTPPLTFSVRGYALSGTAKQLIVQGINKTCKFVMIEAAVRALGLKVDHKCRVLAGIYKTENVDLNKFKSVMDIVVLEYGKYAFDIEYGTAKGIAGCYSVNYELSKLETRKPKKNNALI